MINELLTLLEALFYIGVIAAAIFIVVDPVIEALFGDDIDFDDYSES